MFQADLEIPSKKDSQFIFEKEKYEDQLTKELNEVSERYRSEGDMNWQSFMPYERFRTNGTPIFRLKILRVRTNP